VFPMHPRERSIEGQTAYRSIREIPVPLERVSLYVPPAIGMQLLAEIAEAAPRELYVNPGADSAELVARAHELGLEPILACSIVAIGESPSRFGE
jgi:uncharacterized protein